MMRVGTLVRGARDPKSAARRRSWAAAAWVLVLVWMAVATPGCGGPRSAADRAARAQRLIEAGNDAYRQGDYRLAVRRYAAAAVERRDDPAAYYGLGMALGKLGRDEEAR